MKKLISLVLFIFFISTIDAQQELLFSNDRYNILSFNPSIAGVFEKDNTYAMANLAYRNQWQGFEGAPTTINGGLDFLIKDANVGLGFTIFNDQIGIDSKFEIAGNYSYHLKTRDGVLSGGIRTAFTQIYSDFNKVLIVDGGDIYDIGEENISVFSVGLGFLYAEEGLKFGASIPSIAAFSNNTRFKNFKTRHVYVNASFKLGDYQDDFRIEPSILFKLQESVPIQAKIGLYAYFNEKFIPGLHYRTDDALALSLGVRIQEVYDIALAYDITLSQIRHVSNNSLEILLGYRFQ